MGLDPVSAVSNAVGSIAGVVESWGEAKTKRIQSKTERVVEVQKSKASLKKKRIDAEKSMFDTREGTRRALIKKNIRYLRWALFVILFAPLAWGAVEVWLTGAAVGLGTYFDAIDNTIPEWWVQSIRAVVAFVWASGEVVNVGNDIMDAVADGRRAKAEQARAEANREEQRRQAEEARERAAREERAARGEKPEPPASRPGPPGGGP